MGRREHLVYVWGRITTAPVHTCIVSLFQFMHAFSDEGVK